jgi:hypothetical protein
MSITPQDRIHGACIANTILEISKAFPSLKLAVRQGADRSSYSFELHDESSGKEFGFGFYVKYSRKRLSPWVYSYDRAHQIAIQQLAVENGEAFSVFVNGEDGYTCLDLQGLRDVLDEQFDDVEWIRISRKLRESYRVSGKNGSLERPVAQTSFPQVILDYVGDVLIR